MNITLIRHGLSLANEAKVWTGRMNVALSPAGAETIKHLADEYAYPEGDTLFASPLQRCVQSAHLLYGRNPIILGDELSECSFGVLEGKPYTDLTADRAYQSWLSNPDAGPDGGESLSAFVTRIRTGFAQFVERCRLECRQSVVLVTHGDVIRAILHAFVTPDSPYDVHPIPNNGWYALHTAYDGTLHIAGRGPAALFSLDKDIPYQSRPL